MKGFRVRRSTAITFVLVAILASFFLLPFILPRSGQTIETWTGSVFPKIVIFNLAIDIGLLVISFGRLRDIGLSGYWAMVPTILIMLSHIGIDSLSGLALLATLAIFILCLFPGTIGPNKYGPDPRGWKSQTHYDDYQANLKR